MNAPGARVRAPLPLTPASCKRVAVAGPSKDRRVGRLFMCSGAPDDMEGRGDLRGGKNKARNEQILALKKTFYSSPELSEEIPDSEKGGGRGHGARSIARAIASDLLLGIIRDMPLCRWDNVMLPGFNQVLNVWQPIYTHLFESIIAKPQPWYYVHLHTPGGTDNLMNPDYALDDPTSRAPRVGTLMRIQSAERTEDSRLALVVQGLVRVRVVEQTQKEPFTRATVQLLPDDEITASYYKSAARLMTDTYTHTSTLAKPDINTDAATGSLSPEQQSGATAPSSSSSSSAAAAAAAAAFSSASASSASSSRSDRGSWVHTLAHAAAVVSELDWQEFENACIPLTVHGGVTKTADVAALSPLSAKEGLEEQLSQHVPLRQQDAMEEALSLVKTLERKPNLSSAILGAPVLSITDLTASGVLGAAASLPAWDGWLEVGETEEMEGETEEMEAKLWVEVDTLLRHFNRLQHGVSIPWQMLGLLPDKPEGDWPQHFSLEKVAKSMTALQLPPRPPPVTECAGQMVGTGRQCAFTRVGNKYDPLRRAQKVSYLASFLLGVDQGVSGQAMLEARSTRHRLAMLLKLLVDLNCDLAKKEA
eukprot:Tamp_07800.p1 GENE.Tamp_07800~~Tamp_07800.p1  ORF type:complete len:592 (-),score=123.98 Tamp_07800:658-2433(-)